MAAREEYRLQTLLKLRERKKDEAEHELMTRLKALHQEQKRLHDMEGELERTIARRKARMRDYGEKSMRGEMNAQSVASANGYIDHLRKQESAQKSVIEGQKGVIRQRQSDVDAARRDVVIASQELQALEKHRETWVKKRQREEQRREENSMDEIALAIRRSRGE